MIIYYVTNKMTGCKGNYEGIVWYYVDLIMDIYH
jgi:hypothetical protein